MQSNQQPVGTRGRTIEDRFLRLRIKHRRLKAAIRQGRPIEIDGQLHRAHLVNNQLAEQRPQQDQLRRDRISELEGRISQLRVTLSERNLELSGLYVRLMDQSEEIDRFKSFLRATYVTLGAVLEGRLHRVEQQLDDAIS